MDKCSLNLVRWSRGKTKGTKLSSSSKEREELQQATSTMAGYDVKLVQIRVVQI